MDKCKHCTHQTFIKCSECSSHYCNNLSSNISHLIYHMVKTKHKSISLFGHQVICKNCSEKNLFRLGVDKDALDHFKQVNEKYFALARECMLVKQLEDLNISTDFTEEDNQIKEKQQTNDSHINKPEFSSCCSAISSENSENEGSCIDEKSLIQLLENVYCGKCKDLTPLIADKRIVILPSFESGVDSKSFMEEPEAAKIKLYFEPSSYLATFIPLIQAECLKEKEIKESMKQENVNLKFVDEYCYFTFKKPNNDLKINIGDEIKFTHKSGISFIGFICEEQFSEQIRAKITKNDYPKTGYTIEYIWKAICYDRMIWALKKLYKDRKKNEIFKYIMKGRKERMGEIEVLQPACFSKLNESQEIAVKAALTRTLTLIQGPPGTGKTMVSAVIVYNLVKHYGKKVLVVAPSNTAVDQLAIKINSTGLKVLRVMSKRREGTSSDVDFLCLHNLLKEFNDKDKAKNELVKLADVICCTCVTAGQKLFNNYSFPFVLIDEAVQSTEPLSLIPCVYNATKLILVGDHKQLGPTILNKDAVKKGFKQSLFERLLKIGVSPYLLSIQYRMHPDLCMFPSEYFYSGLLKSGTSTSKVLDFPNNFFYVCNGKEEISQSGTSFVNKSEAVLVENIIRFLFKNGVLEQQIGVITPYEGQRSYILSRIFGNEAGNLEISNVDGFQGREKDFIIVSLVRSNVFQGIGFVADKRRMNVTLTRAKHGLIIIGNPFTLYKSQIWANLLNWYDEKQHIYEGPLNALRQVSLKSYNLKFTNDEANG